MSGASWLLLSGAVCGIASAQTQGRTGTTGSQDRTGITGTQGRSGTTTGGQDRAGTAGATGSQDRTGTSGSQNRTGTTGTQNQGQFDAERHAGKQETIRGVVAGVTVAGEMAINYKTNRAEAVEMSYLTVIGSPVHHGMRGAGTGAGQTGQARISGEADRSSMGGRHRHNVYVVWLNQNPKIRDASTGGADQAGGRSNERAATGRSGEMSWEQLEVGDHVEIVFARRDMTEATGSNAQAAPSATGPWAGKHGRHRTYFGDAVAISILPESATYHSDSGAGRGTSSTGGFPNNSAVGPGTTGAGSGTLPSGTTGGRSGSGSSGGTGASSGTGSSSGTRGSGTGTTNPRR